MGEMAAELVITNSRTKITNPFSFIRRASLWDVVFTKFYLVKF
jgi:hypothetical protein